MARALDAGRRWPGTIWGPTGVSRRSVRVLVDGAVLRAAPIVGRAGPGGGPPALPRVGQCGAVGFFWPGVARQ
eukprot:11160568-Lingulodinium_polyedra.AAC.1